MARVRGREVRKLARKDAQVWEWEVSGALWQFKLTPQRELYRQGRRLDGSCEHLLCVDDAVLASLGFEYCVEHFCSDHERGET